jgi:lysozyme family protein
MSAFETALAFVLEAEGGYSFDASDPGGETQWGISKRSYPHLNIKTLTKEDASVIYERDFWTPLHLGELPPALALLVFNSAVNQGQPTAGLLLQQALNLKADGILGPATVAAAISAPLLPLLEGFCVRQLIRYSQVPRFPLYALGWFSRTIKCYRSALSLV